jgi:hypothetical protein
MKVSSVHFGQHVLSQTIFRVGERYIGLGTITNLEYDKATLLVSVKKDDGTFKEFAIPSANIAYMELKKE